jgi:DNA polymerase-1
LLNKLKKRKLQSLYGNSDKDFAQLVSENIFMYKPARMGNGIKIGGALKGQEIQRPEQVIDYRNDGDAADNIPSLPGVKNS